MSRNKRTIAWTAAHRVQIMAGTEPLNEDSSPPHRKAQKSSKAPDGGKIRRSKKKRQTGLVPLNL